MTNETWSRADLIEAVAAGTMTPQLAEAHAREQGLEPLASTPPTSEFDPMKIQFWTIPMAVAWIAFRTPEAVIKAWDDYRQQCLRWVPEGPGHVLAPLTPATLAELQVADDERNHAERDLEYSDTVDDAVNYLIVNAQRGEFAVSGVGADAAEILIPTEEWRALKLIDDGGEVVAVPRDEQQNAHGYRQLKINRLDAICFYDVRPSEPEPVMVGIGERPDGDGYMPFYDAVLWIASEGGDGIFNARDTDVWQAACNPLIAKITSERIRLIGREAGRGTPVPVPPYSLSGIPMALPYGHMPLDLYVSEAPYLDVWDNLIQEKGRMHWTDLRVHKSDIREQFTQNAPHDDAGDSSVKGKRGPKAKYPPEDIAAFIALVVQEFGVDEKQDFLIGMVQQWMLERGWPTAPSRGIIMPYIQRLMHWHKINQDVSN